MYQTQQERGPWLEEKTLGSGGFGTVVLWKNKESGEQVALKRCRVQNEMTPKHRERWQLEVDIMKRLNHANVVMALDVPPELNVSSEELPLLAMEYCSKGDLRKALNLAENCCGMQEYDIRCLTHDVASALEYLHGNRIIHRDLKPENIVLQQVDDLTVYKLIDLGYAKELDQGSVCTSFVGTLQYLAPELFASKQYSQTVDYWSFGTVIFECITGTRPFLPTVPPVKWHREVCAKSPEDICAWIDGEGEGEVKFSKTLPPPFNLCIPMTSYMEQWLRLMLRWDPKQRGGGVVQLPDNTYRPKCFLLLDQILATKIVHILNVEANQMLSYPLKGDSSMEQIQISVELETKIPVSEQDLLLASGISPDMKSPAVQCWSDPREEEWVVFLFRKGGTGGNPRRRKLPSMLQCIVKEPNTLLPFNEQRLAWAQAVFYLQLQNKDFKRLILSQRAAMLNLLRINSKFVKLKTKMMSDLEKLMARKDHFKESLEFDIQQYKDQASGGVTSERMFNRWTRMGEEIETYMQLKDRASQLDSKSGVITTKIVELQKSPFGKTRQNETLTECEDKAKSMYQELRQTPKEHRASALTGHNPMVQLVVRSVLSFDKAQTDLYVHLNKVMECRQELHAVIPELERSIDEISAASNQISAHQKGRQQDIWMLVKVALKQAKPGLPRSYSGPTGIGASTATAGQVTMMSVPSDISLVSMQIMEDSRQHNKRLKDMMNDLMKEQEEGLSILSLLDEQLAPPPPAASAPEQASQSSPQGQQRPSSAPLSLHSQAASSPEVASPAGLNRNQRSPLSATDIDSLPASPTGEESNRNSPPSVAYQNGMPERGRARTFNAVQGRGNR